MTSTWRDAIDNCTDEGVTERPPVPGVSYVAYTVHPREPGPITLAIAHRDGDMRILDLLRDRLTVAQSAALLHAYGIREVVGDFENDELTLVRAMLGAINLCRQQTKPAELAPWDDDWLRDDREPLPDED
jgi:hypothetical protein